MDEDFEIGVGLRVDGGHFVQRQFARQSDAVRALRQRELDAFRAGDAGLRGGVEFQIGGDLAGQFEHADILDDERVDTGFRNGTDDARGLGEFVFEDECVERQITAHAPAVQRPHCFG